MVLAVFFSVTANAQFFQDDWTTFNTPTGWTIKFDNEKQTVGPNKNAIGKMAFVTTDTNTSMQISFSVYTKGYADTIGKSQIWIDRCSHFSGNPNPNSKKNIRNGQRQTFESFYTDNYYYDIDCLDFLDRDNLPETQELLAEFMGYKKIKRK